MNFWESSGYKYIDFVDMSNEKLLNVIQDMSRNDIIQWLCWNDPNGIYSDERSMKEFENILSRTEAVEILLRQCEENRVYTTSS